MENSPYEQTVEPRMEELVPGELSPEDKDEIYATAVCHASLKLSLYIHSMVYVLVMLLLLVINLMTSSTMWVVWPLLGWGAGLAVHWFAIMKLVPIYQSMKEKEIIRQLEIRQGQ